MPITVAEVQAVLSGLCGNWLKACDLDGSPTSTVFLYPIARSLAELGVLMANPLTVTDADLITIEQDDTPQLIDVAELWSLTIALENYAKADQSQSPGLSIRFARLRYDMVRYMKDKSEMVRQRYGFGRGVLTGGVVELDFAETFDATGSVLP